MYFNQMDIIFLHYPENIFVILSGGKKPSNFSTASLLEEEKKKKTSWTDIDFVHNFKQ